MRPITAFAALFLVLGCQDRYPLAPDLEVGPELDLAAAAQARGDRVKMVPLKLKGTFWVEYFGPGFCEGSADNFRMVFPLQGTGTHLGRFTGSGVNCYSPTGEFLSQATTMTVANGDELHTYGSPGLGTGGTMNPDGSATTGPLFIEGGTGRFEKAEGSFFLWVSNTTLAPGTFRVHGQISSVGSSQ